MLNVMVAVRKSSPTRTAVLLVDAVVGPPCGMGGTVTVATDNGILLFWRGARMAPRLNDAKAQAAVGEEDGASAASAQGPGASPAWGTQAIDVNRLSRTPRAQERTEAWRPGIRRLRRSGDSAPLLLH